MTREVVLAAIKDSVDREFAYPRNVLSSLQIVNRGTGSLTLKIHKLEITVDANEVLDEAYRYFSSFSVEATGEYEILIREVIDDE